MTFMTLMTGLSPTMRPQTTGQSGPGPGPGPGPGTGPSLATLPVAPAGRWHAGAASVSVTGDRVQSASAETGPALSAGGAGVGPQVGTDAQGRDFWHFDGTAYLDVGAGLTFSSRQMAVFAVVRILGGNSPVFGIGNRTGYGAGSTHTNTGGASLDTSTSGQVAPFVRAYSRSARSDAGQKHNVIGGQQVQVMGAVTRSSGNGGSRLYLNDAIASVAHPGINATNVEGAEIGRRVDAPGTSGKWAKMDLYELVVYDQVLSDAQGAAIAAALTQHWAIPQVTSQLVLEGDSIMAGAGADPANNAARVLSKPGAGQVPGAMRVTTAAISGNRIADLTARRDLSNGWASQVLPGQNIMAFEIGRNDFTKGPLSTFYDDVVAYLNTPTTGVLQRGWDVRVLINIASGSAIQPEIDAYRALLRAPQFLTDLNAGPGQAFEGRVTLVETDQITEGAAGTLFATTADAGDNAYYQGDATHPSNPGIIARATGADTPQHGIAAGLI